MTEAIVELVGVDKDYPLGKTVVRALRGVDLRLARGEFATLSGPSGSGKTTLLNLIGCVDVATRGVVRVAGHDTATLKEKALTALRLRAWGSSFRASTWWRCWTCFRTWSSRCFCKGA